MTRRRYGTPLLVGGALLATALLAALTGGDDGAFTARLDPGSAAPDGSRAVAQVLEDQGVEVTVVRDAEAFEDTNLGGAAVVVTSAADLGQSTLRRLVDHARGSPVLVVEPPTGIVEELAPQLAVVTLGSAEGLRGECDNALLDDLRLRVDAADGYRGAEHGCFTVDGAAVHARAGDHVTLLGAGSILTNDQVTAGDNAAAALRLLGQKEHLVWYVPDPADQVAGDAVSLESQLPDWIGPGLGLLTAAGLALLLWRGRRLGPLVTEPLPVTVRSIEATRGRGRLYRRADARGHAGDVLRDATRRRLAARLRLPRTGADPHHLVDSVAHATGRPHAEVGPLLFPAVEPATTDRDLLDLARRLHDLEEALDIAEQVDPRP